MNTEAVQECIAAHMSKNKEEEVAKTARNDKTKPVFKGPYKIIHLHPNNVAEIIENHPNSKSIKVHFKLLRRPHLVSGSSSQEQSCSQQPPT
ncbi:unnamed protein product [Leptidea sinapis]|uniref:Uncharacterized protein n=1 Tax=Leptidea sinapis TaxID=189913 RepID=A0A5E4QR56_9NEOP|nr:unnamed protein product [Leptidea sinapis]